MLSIVPGNAQNLFRLLVAAAAFGLVLSLWLVGVLLWSLRKRRRAGEVQSRLQMVQSNVQQTGDGRVLRLWHDGREATTVVYGEVAAGGIAARFRKLFADAGVESMQSTLSMLVVGLAAAATAAYLATSSVMAALAAAVAVYIGFYIYLTQRIARRRTTFDRQLIDALDLAARSLRVGHPLVGSFQMIAQEIPAPVGKVFGEVCQQQELGVAMDQALRQVARRSDSDDLKLFATSVVIQLGSGGNLADMMERVANVIRERNRLARRVRVLTAQTQFSKRILLALPFFIFCLLNVINADYMRPLYATFTGQMVMLCSGVGLLLGWITMNWLSRLPV